MDPRVMQVTYIGQKRVKRDTVAGTDTIWMGYGDSQEVPYKQGVNLLQHPDVWMRTDKFLEAEGDSATMQDAGFSGSQGGEPNPEEQKDPNPNPNPQANQDPQENQEDKKDSEAQAIELSVMNAILSLNPENEEHFSTAGTPKVSAVQNALGDVDIKVTGKMVESAWKQLGKKN